jgi:hypothetical protein
MTSGFWKRLAFAGFVLAQGCVAASAATNVCIDLQARLDALNRNGSATSDAYRVYDLQVNQQRAALERASSDARAMGCYGGGFFAQRPSPQCPQIIATISSLQANINQLAAQRDQYRADPYILTNQRNDVLRQMSLNRCGNFAAYEYTPPLPPIGSGGLLASIFGGGIFGNGYFGGGYYGNTYRTLCVRTCDGYYFPISFSTTPERFATDQRSCQAMCPGTEVSLYIHRNPGEEVESMVSISGGRYTALPTAFKYRTSYDSNCSCGAPSASLMDQLTAQAAALTPQYPPYQQTYLPPVPVPGANATFYPIAVPPTAAALPPIPTSRPAWSEDPETLADRAGGLVPTPLGNPSEAEVAGVTKDGRPIRLVGPAYYIAQ